MRFVSHQMPNKFIELPSGLDTVLCSFARLCSKVPETLQSFTPLLWPMAAADCTRSFHNNHDRILVLNADAGMPRLVQIAMRKMVRGILPWMQQLQRRIMTLWSCCYPRHPLTSMTGQLMGSCLMPRLILAQPSSVLRQRR